MIQNYTAMKSFLDSNNMSHEDMDEKWSQLAETNKIVKNLSEHGKNWTDLPEHLLVNMIQKAAS